MLVFVSLGTLVYFVDHVAHSIQIDTICPDRHGIDRAIAAAPPFADYLDLACGQIRRYGAAEPAVCLALLRLLGLAAAIATDPHRLDVIAAEARLVLADAERHIAQPEDLDPVRALTAAVLHATEHEPTGITAKAD